MEVNMRRANGFTPRPASRGTSPGTAPGWGLPAVLLLGLLATLLAWWWPNRAQLGDLPMPAERLNSVSFAPFRTGDSPLRGIFPSAAEVEEDMRLIAPRIRGIRTYASIEGDYDVAAIAARNGLKLWQGAWLSGTLANNEREVARLIESANRHPETVERVVVGNEVLLRRDLPPAALIGYLDRVRAAVRQPVTYADVWEFWQQFPEVARHVDIVTIHILPYWEDEPLDVEAAIANTRDIVHRMRALFPGKPIAIGDEVKGELGDGSATNDEGQRADTYRFAGTTGQRVAIEMKSGDFDTYLTLRRASDGTVLAQDDDGAGSGTDSRIARTLYADGDYVIEARGFSDDAEGDYTLKLSETAAPPAPTAATFGQTIEGEITDDSPQADDGKRYHAYAFTGAKGQRVQAVLRSGDFDAYLEIGRAEGDFEALASDDDGLAEGTDSRLTFTLPDDGEYIVRAMPLSAEEKGLYSFELSDRGPEPKPGSLLVGATVRGELKSTSALTDEGAYFDAYRFQAKKDEKLRLTMVSNAFDSFIDLGRLDDDGDFASLATDDDSLSDAHAKLDWTAPEDGWYVVRARAYGPNQTGAYALAVERQPATGARSGEGRGQPSSE